MSQTRQPAVAGTFYPDDPEVLRNMVGSYLGNQVTDASIPKAIIAPHAGYIYSGPIAGSAYKRLIAAKETIKKVILLGPSHYVAFEGVALPESTQFSTPLGNITVDQENSDRIAHLPQVQRSDIIHSQEHSLEVHLPFLQCSLESFTLTPLVVGDCPAGKIEEVLNLLWGGDETLIVISSDLSHYHNYATAQLMDQQTSEAIENLEGNKISYEQACGRTPILGLLKAAISHNMKATTIDLRNSGDTAGTKDRVVGYGSYVFD